MAKTKRKTRKESEHKDGIIREQAKLIKSLKQRLRQYEKYEQNREDSLLDEEVDVEEIEKRKVPCDSCGKGYYDELDLGIKVICTCNICGDRKTL